jgi:hypothetical protein
VKIVPMLFASSALLLAACGGGGGGTGGQPPTNPPPTQTPNTTTNAQGTVVDDATGAAIAGVKVQLDPWTTYPTPGPTPTPIFTTTTDANGHFTIEAQNGTYLLVIGNDAVYTPPPGWGTPAPNATDTPIPGASGWTATIHDRVVLNGQTTLVAPTMPPEPAYTPVPAETSGNYRISTLDALTQVPCILAYNQKRISLGLPAAVADEWSLENTRDVVKSTYNLALTNSNGTEQFITGGTGHASVSGGANCAAWTASPNIIFGGQSQALNPQALWYGGYYYMFAGGGQAFGAAENPIDPRFPDSVDPSPVPIWP